MLVGPVLVLLAGLVIASRLLAIGPLPNLDTLPAYPNATNLKQIANDTALTQTESATTPRNVTTFDTADSTKSVLSFYKDRLEREGWKAASPQGQDSNSESFAYDESSPGAGNRVLSTHRVDIKIEQGQGNIRHVTVSQYRIDH